MKIFYINIEVYVWMFSRKKGTLIMEETLSESI